MFRCRTHQRRLILLHHRDLPTPAVRQAVPLYVPRHSAAVASRMVACRPRPARALQTNTLACGADDAVPRHGQAAAADPSPRARGDNDDRDPRPRWTSQRHNDMPIDLRPTDQQSPVVRSGLSPQSLWSAWLGVGGFIVCSSGCRSGNGGTTSAATTALPPADRSGWSLGGLD